MALLVGEFSNRIGGPVRVAVGAAIDPAAIAARTGDARGLNALWAETHARASMADLGYGFAFGDGR